MSEMKVHALTPHLHHFRQIAMLSAALCLILTAYKPVYASEAIIIGGGSDIQNASGRFETTVDWLQGILHNNNVQVQTYYNDGNESLLDTSYRTDDQPAPLSRVFGKADAGNPGFRQHQLKDVHGSSDLPSLQAGIADKLSTDKNQELLLVSVGLSDSSNSNHAPGNSDVQASMRLWNNTQLNATQLHELIHEHERPIRYVFAHDRSGSFHRLAYQDPVKGRTLSDVRHCGFTSTTAYSDAETSTLSSDISDYNDYATVFFSAISGYEIDGEIISRFPDLNKDGVTSFREAHLYTLEEARSIELSLSSSEDYLLHWQPWYLRWQPASKQLPNNEYTRIFRDLANALDISLEGNVARKIRQRMASTLAELQTLQLQHTSQLQRIKQLQDSLMSAAVRQWPALAFPYTQGYEQLIRDQQISAINTSLSQNQPDYTELVELQTQIEPSLILIQDRQRELTQYNKLLRLRHLALLKQQLFEHGTAATISDYRSLVQCEEAPLKATADFPVLSEDITQTR